jgi:hypothetical protein
MAKIHAFDFGEGGVCRVILHTAMPPGNNIVGNSWKNVWIAAGRNTTSMAEGTGVGTITTTEKASIVAGNVIEISGQIPSNIVVQGAVAVNAFADNLITEVLARLATQLNYYGWTNG